MFSVTLRLGRLVSVLLCVGLFTLPLPAVNVSPDGSANYSIPIPVPAVAQKQLQGLGIVYNSAAGAGDAGYGWSLAGIPSISRMPADAGMTWGINDRFMGPDGLLVSAGAPGKYQPAVQNWNKYEINPAGGSCIDDLCGWILYNNKGDRFYFGVDSAGNNPARLQGYADTQSAAYAVWYLSEIKFANGEIA